MRPRHTSRTRGAVSPARTQASSPNPLLAATLSVCPVHPATCLSISAVLAPSTHSSRVQLPREEASSLDRVGCLDPRKSPSSETRALRLIWRSRGRKNHALGWIQDLSPPWPVFGTPPWLWAFTCSLPLTHPPPLHPVPPILAIRGTLLQPVPLQSDTWTE